MRGGDLCSRTVDNSGQFEAAFDAIEALIEAVCRKLLRGVGGGQVSQVLND